MSRIMIKVKNLLLIFFLFIICPFLKGQSSQTELFADKEKTAGVYLAYPLDFKPQTKVPEGYAPFISAIMGDTARDI